MKATEELTGLEKRLLEEPDYRPYCLSCHVMTRMKLIEEPETGQRLMWCEPVEEDHPLNKLMPGLAGPPRYGCGIKFDIHTGNIVVAAAGKGVYKYATETD